MFAIDRKSGKKIIGTLEALSGRAELMPYSFERTGDGTTFKSEHSGHTDIFYDDQVTVERDGQVIYLTEDRTEVRRRDVKLVKDDPDGIPQPQLEIQRYRAAAPDGTISRQLFDSIKHALEVYPGAKSVEKVTFTLSETEVIWHK